MSYPAKEQYSNKDIASEYDKERFSSIIGKIIDWREKHIILKAMGSSNHDFKCGVLDIPCGTGRLSYFLSEQGYDLVAADISSEMLVQVKLKEKSLGRHQDIDLVNADAECLPFSKDAFDIVVSLRLFGHLPPNIRKKVLGEFHRISKSRIVVAYYMQKSIQGLLRKQRRKKAETQWYPITRADLLEEIESVGLKIEGEWPLTFYGFSETIVVQLRNKEPQL